MTDKVYVVTDLGPGDGGKGGVVHKLAIMRRAHTIIKRGGAQGSHGVRTSKGEEFAFSQWGCGTFEGIPTHLSEQMVVSPEGLLNEAEALRYRHDIADPFGLLTVDERALCATPFHGIASRLKELTRGTNPRGTVGTGVGEAYRAFRHDPASAILARDLHGSELQGKLAVVRDQVRHQLKALDDSGLLPEDREPFAAELALLYDDGFLSYVVERFRLAARLTNIVGSDYLGDRLQRVPGAVVVETSHGVLTDRQFGFEPHTSAIRTLPSFTQSMLRSAGYEGKIVQLGLTRAYAIRHGAGPLPTADPDMVARLLPGSHKDTNRYQGEVRVGPLDTVLLRYAIAACGGSPVFDGLVVSCFDQVVADGQWLQCHEYSQFAPALFASSGEILLDRRIGERHRQYQAALRQALENVVPVVIGTALDPQASVGALYAHCAETMYGALTVPVRMVSFGPTERDKVCK